MEGLGLGKGAGAAAGKRKRGGGDGVGHRIGGMGKVASFRCGWDRPGSATGHLEGGGGHG